MVDPMPHDPMTDWSRVLRVGGLGQPVIPSDPGRWWLQHIVGTAQNMEFPPSDHDDFMWLVREIAHGASEAENWLSIFACLSPDLQEDEQDQLEMICKAALQLVAERIVYDIATNREG